MAPRRYLNDKYAASASHRKPTALSGGDEERFALTD
jgi:ABC-type thiamine transport system ATPase subunit